MELLRQKVTGKTVFASAMSVAWAGSLAWLLCGYSSERLAWFWVLVASPLYLLFLLLERIQGGTKDGDLQTDSQTSRKEEIAGDSYEQQYEQASFIAKVSHELRTPIHNILGLLQIIYKAEKNPTSRYYLKMIRHATDGLLGTINDVLDFSKADTGMLRTKMVSTELAPVIRDALQTISARALDKPELELVCEWGVGVPTHVTTDGIRLRQVLVNLLGNAIKFTSDGSVSLTVELVPESNSDTGKGAILELAVHDTGIGIPAHKLRTIFEPFSQVDMTVVRKSQGSGLGLTIVQQIATSLKGEVAVESVLGEGSVFTFSIPVTTAECLNVTERTQAFECSATINGAKSKPKVGLAISAPHLLEVVQYELIQGGVELVEIDSHAVSTDPLLEKPHYIIASGDSLNSDGVIKAIEEQIKHGTSATVLVLLSPADLRGREICTALGITKILTVPCPSCDVVNALFGSYVEQINEDAWEGLVVTSQPLNILIADDLPTNQLILKSLLEDAGHKVHVVSDGQELLDHIRPQIESQSLSGELPRFDIVLTDIQMPKIDGIGVITRTREIERRQAHLSEIRSQLPIVAVTAHAFTEEHNRIMAAGASGVITKPIQARALQELLDKIVSGESKALRGPSVAKAMKEDVSVVPVTPKVDDGAHFLALAKGVCDAANPSTENGNRKVYINIADVFHRSGDSVRRTQLIFRSFLGCYAGILKTVTDLDLSSSPQEVRGAVHAIYGLLVEVGASEAASIAASIECRVRDEDAVWNELPSEICMLSSSVEEIAQLIQALLAGISVDRPSHQAI